MYAKGEGQIAFKIDNYSEEFIKDVIFMYHEGYSKKEICEDKNLEESDLNKILELKDPDYDQK